MFLEEAIGSRGFLFWRTALREERGKTGRKTRSTRLNYTTGLLWTTILS